MIDGNTKRDALINKVIAYLEKQLPENQHQLIAEFVRRYYSIAAYEDLRERSIMDLAGAILSHWNLIYQRKLGETKIHVFNPNYETDGWQSTHTIIDIVHDDMPFLVDTVRMEISRRGIPIHFVVHPGGIRVRRDKQNCITEILPCQDTNCPDVECVIHFEINRINDEQELKSITEDVQRVLNDVEQAVSDWPGMVNEINACVEDLIKNPPPLAQDEIDESIAFLKWLADGNFTFLGFRDYELIGEGEQQALKIIDGTGLGVLSDSTNSQVLRQLSGMTPEARKILLSAHILIIAKTNTKATVHRHAYTDYIGVKRFNEKGEVIGERRFIGLFTSIAYHSNPQNIPFLRLKVQQVLDRSNLNMLSHAGKELLNILETFPRDDLFQTSIEELSAMAIGILNLQERSKVRLFVRKDVYGRYMSCLVYVPKDRYNTEARNAISNILQQAFDGIEVSFTTLFGESVLARIHYVIRIDPNAETPDYDVVALEKKLIEVTRLWRDELYQILLEHYGEEQGTKLYNYYENSFPASYRDDFEPRIAVADIKYIEKVIDGHQLGMGVYRPLTGSESNLHFKLFQADETIPLSDVIPILENMGLRVLDERPYELFRSDGKVVWINDFDMVLDHGDELNTTLIKDIFKNAFAKFWFNEAQNDGFNRLILSALLTWREVVILRAYAKYLRQLGFTFSQNYIERVFTTYPELAKLLVRLFKLRFDPSLAESSQAEIEALNENFEQQLDKVSNLDEDRIFRCYHNLINATVRTNYFQKNQQGEHKRYISFKFEPENIPEVPLPKPMYEIYVYSPDFEGVHLRSDKVARGGLRWSDRLEDYRTEILGLMKAQSVKNSVIVPAGAKGGFVLKRAPIAQGRDAVMQKVVHSYQNFIRGLLDITDNIHDKEIIKPDSVVCYDSDDPYLVVAADKGTSTFSDIANEVAAEYDFWLGDAFASGGSNGYDHKKMGITARGAWESVKRHFENLGINTQTTDFTVVGIGDMAGDVFGNGMLLSEHIKLVAAFNHVDIFIDPNPDPKISYKERKRLFEMPRSTWQDYNAELISKGGGVFKRSDKSIKLTPEIKKLLNLEQDYITPNELIKKILTAKVDLLWNGGIGTYVKSMQETNVEVGDKSNDLVRVDGRELQCRVVGEGGNLGFTQLGRIEFALDGGQIYTDFIDNSAGVDCSDHEVNLKILLNNAVTDNKLSFDQRNKLLANLSSEISQLCLRDNIEQTKAIDLSLVQSVNVFDLTKRYMNDLDREGTLNRTLEFLPSNKTLTERKAKNIALTAPEIAILLAYTKNFLKHQIKSMDLVDSEAANTYLKMAFPKKLAEKFPEELRKHQLRDAIIATEISNMIVNEMGSVFVYRMIDETGATVEAIVKAYIIAREVFGIAKLWKLIDALPDNIEKKYRNKMTISLIRLVRRATRWFLRNYRANFDINDLINHYKDKVTQLHKEIPTLLIGRRKEIVDSTIEKYHEVGIPVNVITQMASVSAMFSALDIIQAAEISNKPFLEFAKYYFTIGNELNLAWLREQINSQAAENHWETLSLSAVRDDLDRLQRVLAISIINFAPETKDIEEKIKLWLEQHQRLVDRWFAMEANIRASRNISITMLFVGLRELLDLAQTSTYNREMNIPFNPDNYV